MRALSYLTTAGETGWNPTSIEAPRAHRATQALRVAINFVFGMPFLWMVLVAVRGPLWWGSHRLFGDGVGRYSALLWVMAAAVGALWLGVSLLFANTRRQRLAGTLLIIVAAAWFVALRG